MVTLAYQGIPSVVVYEVNGRTSLTSGLPGVHMVPYSIGNKHKKLTQI